MKDKPLEKIVLITDGLTPTEQEGDDLTANGEKVVFEGGCFHRAADGVIAGSSLTMIRGVKNLVKFGFSVSDAVRAASSTPASVMHYNKKGMLIPGYDADVVVFDKQFNIIASILRGVFKKNLL